MNLQTKFAAEIGTFRLVVDLEFPSGSTTAVLGPNGAGKTSLLRAIAGLLPIESGAVTLGGDCFDRPDAGIFVPPERRRVGMVFQDYALFAHLDLIENVAFGLRARGRSRASARAAASEWVERLGLGAFSTRRPGELSGGQQQRVALARALASEPAVLLLDEPLAALDAEAREETRELLARHLEGFDGVRVLVTHAIDDAIRLADRLVVLEDGRASFVGKPGESPADLTPYLRSAFGGEMSQRPPDHA